MKLHAYLLARTKSYVILNCVFRCHSRTSFTVFVISLYSYLLTPSFNSHLSSPFLKSSPVPPGINMSLGCANHTLCLRLGFPEADLRQGFVYKWFVKETQKVGGRESGSETGKGRRPIKGVLSNRLPLWATT